ncbi:uncharacterized protein LOC144448109 [Glandiceps talaboti]
MIRMKKRIQTFALVITFLSGSMLVFGIPRPFCDDTEFMCNDGQCIDAALSCDGNKDCYDGNDETDCATTAANIYRCSIDVGDSFICDDGECLSTSRLCNGIQDCTSGVDEDCGTDAPMHTPSIATSVIILTVIILFICGALFGTLVFLQQRRMFQMQRRQRQLSIQRQSRQIQVVTSPDLFTTMRDSTDEESPRT